jgi:hypothetical protein
METKMSSEAVLIKVLAENLWHDMQLLDEAIVRYIDNKGGTVMEVHSYKNYFDKRFPAFSEKMRGIDMGITSLLETGEKD